MSTNSTDKVVWFVVGVAAGAAVALLYAPVSGKDTRRYLRKKGEQARDTVVEKSGQVVEKGREIGDDIVERGRKIYQRGVEIAGEATELLERGRKLVRT